MMLLAQIDIVAWEIAATAVGTIIVTVGTLALWRMTSRSKREHEIEQAINAQISDHLTQFLDLSDRSRNLAERTEGLQSTADEIQRSVRTDQEKIAEDRAELAALQDELERLRDRWGRLVPTMEAIDQSSELLRMTADQKLELARVTSEPETRETAIREANAYLRRLLQHPDAESRDLELAGDLARVHLRMPALARQLYEKSVTTDPSNVSAQAELAALRIRHPAERDAALEELLTLMTNHPEAKTARFSLFNHFMDVDRYDDLAETCQKLVDSDPADITAWRNLGVALEHIKGDSPETRSAYEKALELTRQKPERGELGNTARPFARLLREEGSPENVGYARELLEEALKDDPLDSMVLAAMGDTLRKQGNPVEANLFYEVAERLGSPVEASYAGKRRREIQVLNEVGLLESAQPVG